MRFRFNARFTFLSLLVGVIVAVVAPAAAQANVEVEKFIGINCSEGHEKCGEKEVGRDALSGGALAVNETVEPNLEESEEQGYRQAAGHAPYGVTDFILKHTGEYSKERAKPTGILTHVRVDVAAGLAASPAAVPQCTAEEFGPEAFPGSGLYREPKCKGHGEGQAGIGPESSVIGEEDATVYVKGLEEAGYPFFDVVVKGELFNGVPPAPSSTQPARSAYYEAALKIPIALTKGKLEAAGVPKPFSEEQYYSRNVVEGNVEFAKEGKGTNVGDYHDYFEVKVNPELPVVRSRQINYGRAGDGAFITNATNCPGDHTTFLKLEGYNANEKETAEKEAAGEPAEVVPDRAYTTLLGLNECQLVPFGPSFALSPETKQQDQPDGITTALAVPHQLGAEEIDSSQLKTASVTLPEGLTINPSAANAVIAACTEAQAHIHTFPIGTSCPPGSKIGTATLEVPTLHEAFTGTVYLGGEGEGATITKTPFPIYIDVLAPNAGVDVRLRGTVTANETTGRLTANFTENPEQPFNNLTLSFNKGQLAPLANPLPCGTATTGTGIVPVSNPGFLATPSTSFAVDSNNAGGPCASPPSFVLGQSTGTQPPTAGAATTYALNLTRGDGQQFLSQVKTTLPAGVIGLLPTVTQCAEAQANAGECPAVSKIGTVGVEAGAGSQPYGFNGNVYLTGPYNGAPFGLSIVVPTVAGPFNFGNVITRGTITVDPYTARVTTTATVPTIVKGVPVRLKKLSVSINKQGFLVNPTNCDTHSTDSTLSGVISPGLAAGATQNISTPFQVGGCSGLPFKPRFTSKTGARTSKANGARLETTLDLAAGSANVKYIQVQLPKFLPSRLTTLQKACPEAAFNANPYSCPSGSFVGGVRANTPALSGKLKGPAILVSHGGEAFPDLDLVMEAEGVRIIVVGNTKITRGITTTTFAAAPDAPVSSITVNLPTRSNSALTALTNLCAKRLVMPTTLIGQNGVEIKQNTNIKAEECGVRVVSRHIHRNTAFIVVQTYDGGSISVSGPHLKTLFRHLKTPNKRLVLRVHLTRRAEHGRGRLFVPVRLGFRGRVVGDSATRTSLRFR